MDAASNSVLADLAQSPAHCWALHFAPDRPERVETAAMRAGTLAHCAVLEPHAFADRYVVRPAGLDARTKAGKEWIADQTRTVVTIEEHDTAKGQQKAVQACQPLRQALSSGHAEVSCFWTDEATRQACKARVDWVHPLPDGRVILVDLKTTGDVSPQAFGRAVWNFGYHRQAAWYSDGFQKADGREVAAFLFATVTNAYPFIAVAYVLDDEALAQGAAQCAELLATYAECRRTNTWPAYGDGVQLLTLPAWAK